MDIDREVLIARMERYFDPDTSNEEMAALMPPGHGEHTGVRRSRARGRIIKSSGSSRVHGPVLLPPVRLCDGSIGSQRRSSWHEKRSEFFPQVTSPDHPVEARQTQPMDASTAAM